MCSPISQSQFLPLLSFLFFFAFQHFYYDMSWCYSLSTYPDWGSHSFFNLEVIVFHKFWNIPSHYSLNLFLLSHFLSPFCLQLHMLNILIVFHTSLLHFLCFQIGFLSEIQFGFFSILAVVLFTNLICCL